MRHISKTYIYDISPFSTRIFSYSRPTCYANTLWRVCLRCHGYPWCRWTPVKSVMMTRHAYRWHLCVVVEPYIEQRICYDRSFVLRQSRTYFTSTHTSTTRHIPATQPHQKSDSTPLIYNDHFCTPHSPFSLVSKCPMWQVSSWSNLSPWSVPRTDVRFPPNFDENSLWPLGPWLYVLDRRIIGNCWWAWVVRAELARCSPCRRVWLRKISGISVYVKWVCCLTCICAALPLTRHHTSSMIIASYRHVITHHHTDIIYNAIYNSPSMTVSCGALKFVKTAGSLWLYLLYNMLQMPSLHSKNLDSLWKTFWGCRICKSKFRWGVMESPWCCHVHVSWM